MTMIARSERRPIMQAIAYHQNSVSCCGYSRNRVKLFLRLHVGWCGYAQRGRDRLHSLCAVAGHDAALYFCSLQILRNCQNTRAQAILESQDNRQYRGVANRPILKVETMRKVEAA
jgi:hypothetical protein